MLLRNYWKKKIFHLKRIKKISELIKPLKIAVFFIKMENYHGIKFSKLTNFDVWIYVTS